jgi:hypothetical protein
MRLPAVHDDPQRPCQVGASRPSAPLVLHRLDLLGSRCWPQHGSTPRTDHSRLHQSLSN